MKIIVPGIKIDTIDLSVNRAVTECDAEIAEPRVGSTSDFRESCRSAGGFQW